MSYIGDFAAGVTLDKKFTTRRFSTGAPFTLGGTPAVSVYKDNSTTQSTSGVTLTVDFDGVTGLHNVRIDLSSDGTFYSAGSNFDVVITTGTVDSVSVVGETIISFSIANRADLRPTIAGRTLDVSSNGNAGIDWNNIDSPTTTQNLSGTSTKALEPTVAGRTLDVTATGAAGIDWANVENPTTTLALTGTTIATSQVVASVTGSVGSVTGAVGSVTGNVGGNVTGSVGSVVGNVGGNVTGSVGSVVGNVGGNLVGNVNGNVVGSVGSVAGNVSGNVVGSVGSVTGNVGGNVVGTVASVVGNVGGNVTGSVGSVVGNVGGNVVGTVASVVGNVGGNVVGSVGSVVAAVTVGTNNDKTGYTTTTADKQATADQYLARDLQGGSSVTDRNVRNALRPSRNRVQVTAGGAVTVYEEDDATPAWTGTATRTAGADPLTEIDPA